MLNPFNNPEVQEQLSVLFSNLAGDIWATLYSTVLAALATPMRSQKFRMEAGV